MAKKRKKKRKKDTGYQAFVFGAKGILRLLVYTVIVIAVIFAGRVSYDFGYEVFHAAPLTPEGKTPKEVTLTVKKDMGIGQIADLLEDKGIVKSSLVFRVQEMFSDYRKAEKEGTYILDSSMDPEMILKILSQTVTEGQPKSLNQGNDTNGGSNDS